VLDIKTSDTLGQPSAILHVVSPSYLGKLNSHCFYHVPSIAQ